MWVAFTGQVARINRLLAEICGWLLSLMIGFLCLDIISRDIREPVQGVAEMAVFAMISAVYLGLAHCEQMDKHVKVTALVERMPIRVQKGIRVLNYAIMVPVVAILVWSAGSNLIYTYVRHVAVSGTFPLPVWPVSLVMLVGLSFYLIQVIINFGASIKSFASHPGGKRA